MFAEGNSRPAESVVVLHGSTFTEPNTRASGRSRGPVAASGELWEPQLLRKPPGTVFPFPGFSTSTSLCTVAPEEKQTPPLPPLPPSPSSPTAAPLLSSPHPTSLPHGLFFLWQAFPTHDLCHALGRMYTSKHGGMKPEQHVIKYQAVSFCFFGSFGLLSQIFV